MAQKPSYEELKQRIRDLEKEAIKRKRLEQALRASEERYRTLFENANEAIYVAQDEVIKFINPKGEELYGYSQEELASKPFTNFIHEEDQEMVRERHKKRLRGKALPSTYPFRIINKSGETKWVELNVARFSWEDRPAALCLLTDITDRRQAEEAIKQAHNELEQRVEERTIELRFVNAQLKQEIEERKQVEKALRESEERYRTVVENSSDAIRVFAETGHLYANPACLQLLGYEWAELKNLDGWAVVAPEKREWTCDRGKRRLRGEKFETRFELPIVRKDGERLFMEVIVGVVHMDGQPAILSSMRDMTERRRMEVALRESEEKYRTILESIEDGYFEVDLNGKFTFFNSSLCKIHGYSRDELMGMSYRQYMDQQTAKKVYQVFNKVYVTGKPAKGFEYEVIRKDGARRNNEISVALIKDSGGHRIGFRGVVRDVTERVQAEEALAEERNLLRTVIDIVPDYIYVKDTESRYLMSNNAFARLMEKTPEEVVGKTVFELFPKEQASRYYADDQDVFRSGKPLLNKEDRPVDQVGRTLWNLTSKIPLRDSSRKIVGLVGLGRDITDRKRAEVALRESEEKYKTLTEKSLIGVFIVQNGKYVFVNDRFAKIHGYAAEELLGEGSIKLIHPDQRDLVSQRVSRRLAGEAVPDEYEVKRVRKDGETIWCDTMVSLIQYDGRPAIMGNVIDITARKKAEEEKWRLEAQLHEAKRMEAISTLAGGIAHQFNNALTPIIGNIALLEMDYGEDNGAMEILKDMKTSGRQMAGLTSQLLAYARGGKYVPLPVSMSDFVEETLPLIEHTLGPGVRFETDLPLDVLKVEIDRTQMQMVLSAIVANSNEAIAGPGRIRVSTRNIDLDQEFTKGHPGLKPGRYVCLSIEDDGKGMDQATRERVFDPFFTTHFIGRGLGMAAVYGIVSNHDGVVTVDSEPGKGTLVRVYLPAIQVKKEVEEEVTSEHEIEFPAGEATILVIEDEGPVVKVVRRMMGRLGYRLLEARTGQEAIRLARTFDGDIDLALLDVKLPDISGDKVYPVLMEARPDLKVIVFSGYAIDGPVQGILDAGAQGYVQKPFSVATLAGKLKEVLEAGNPEDVTRGS